MATHMAMPPAVAPRKGAREPFEAASVTPVQSSVSVRKKNSSSSSVPVSACPTQQPDAAARRPRGPARHTF